MSKADPNPEYWAEYSNLQHTKHALIKNYLNGWFPKMTLGPTGCSRLLYVDTHAGRGKYPNGQLGSPLVALTTLLTHASRTQILQKAEVQYLFIERNETNAEGLKQELKNHVLPPGVLINPEQGNSFELIQNMIGELEHSGNNLPPGFFFVDPFGFKLPGQLLRKLLEFPKVELFINVIWRELDMAIKQGRADPKSPLIPTLNDLFGGAEWKMIDALDADDRADQCATLFRKVIGAKWGTYIRMLDNGRIRYFLLHLTNSNDGRDLMKECIWKSCPDGGYFASKSENPNQRLLIEPQPDLKPLREWIKRKLTGNPQRWQILIDDLREELWLEKHLNEQIREMRSEGEIEGEKYSGKFTPSNNPILRLRPKQGDLF